MGKFKQKLVNFAARIYFSLVGSPLKQGENIAPEGASAATPGMAPLLRRAAAEGAVLLKNNGILPLKERFALFGRVQTDTFYTGYGSGGDVIKPYRVSILDGCERAGLSLVEELKNTYRAYAKAHPVSHGSWGDWPRSFPEMPLDEGLVARARQEAETAVVVIGRAAGEDRENELIKGSYYLTDDEKKMLELVTQRFNKVAVVLNVGNIIDLSWTQDSRIGAVLLAWQGGMEAGNAVADVLSGAVNPCGKLPDTVALEYADYPSSSNFGNAAYNEYAEDIFVGYRHFETFAPERMLYPFGHGLSYTQFEIEGGYADMGATFSVKNVGTCAGKTVVQVYVRKSNGTIDNPARELVGFYKTKLLAPNETEEGRIQLSQRSFSSYDEGKKAYVMPAGEYRVYIGFDAHTTDMVGGFSLKEEKITCQLSEQCAPKRAFRLDGHGGIASDAMPARKDLKQEILSALPPALPPCEREVSFADVREGKATVEEFVSRLGNEELVALSRGAMKMSSPLGASGNAGVMGGTVPSLREKGVPTVTMTDGPSGIRLKTASSLLPIGTLLASTFDPALVEEVYAAVGGEMRARGSHVLLAPGMNLHRNPLCGRNFEYYSEDPFLTGKIAAAAVRGVQSAGASACPKHFACNNQEFNRNRNNSILSERALRELYLYGFEICVKESAPHFIMTSYNKINGVWAHYHYELVRGILRGEWGFEGCVVTDWWMRMAASPEFKGVKNNAYRIRAGVNVLMPGGGYMGKRPQGGSPLKKLNKKDRLTLGELQQNACEVLNAVLKTSAAKGE